MGGVLVEHSMPETAESLKANIDMLEQALKAMDEKMKKIEKEVFEL